MWSPCENLTQRKYSSRTIPSSTSKLSDRDIASYLNNKKFDGHRTGLDCEGNGLLLPCCAEFFFILIEKFMIIRIYS